jgi:hypothetical protein
MPSRFIVAIVLLAAAVPVSAQEIAVPTAPMVGLADTTQAASGAKPVRFSLPLEQAPRREPVTRPPFLAKAGQTPGAAAPRKHSKAPIVGGIALGALLGFFGGDYIQRSVCEYDCGPGGFTWAFTAIGAGGGAAIGWLISR